MSEEKTATVDAEATQAAVDTATPDTAELKKVIAQRDELKRKLREVEPLAARAKELEQAQMTEQEKLASRLKELEPTAAKAEQMIAVVERLLESELATIPEEYREIIPASLAPEDKLDWLRQAKAKGLFARQEPPPPPQKTSSPLLQRPGATGKTMKRSEFDSVPPAAKMEFIRTGGQVLD